MYVQRFSEKILVGNIEASECLNLYFTKKKKKRALSVYFPVGLKLSFLVCFYQKDKAVISLSYF